MCAGGEAEACACFGLSLSTRGVLGPTIKPRGYGCPPPTPPRPVKGPPWTSSFRGSGTCYHLAPQLYDKKLLLAGFCGKLDSADGCCSFVAERLEASGFQRLLSRARCPGMWPASARWNQLATNILQTVGLISCVSFSGESESLAETNACSKLIFERRMGEIVWGVNIGGSPSWWGREEAWSAQLARSPRFWVNHHSTHYSWSHFSFLLTFSGAAFQVSRSARPLFWRLKE